MKFEYLLSTKKHDDVAAAADLLQQVQVNMGVIGIVAPVGVLCTISRQLTQTERLALGATFQKAA